MEKKKKKKEEPKPTEPEFVIKSANPEPLDRKKLKKKRFVEDEK